MFGMSFFEIFMIAVIAIIFLGPDKLPGAMIEIAKFFKQVKGGLTQAKETFNHELQLDELRENALKYKGQIENSAGEMMKTAKIDEFVDAKNSISNSLNDLKDITTDSAPSPTNAPKSISEALSKKKVSLTKTDKPKVSLTKTGKPKVSLDKKRDS